ncbi:MAG: winged helix-turn-helix transcriptional regulator [Candidatus Thermoplasmatota archaeon]
MSDMGHLPGGSDLQRPGLAEQPMRARLLSLITENPGIHASRLARESGGPWGTVQYHLSLLGKGDLVQSVDTGRERRFFPASTEPRWARLLALLNQGRRPELARYIQANPGLRQVDICDALGVSRKTFRASIGPLVEEGLVHERKGLQTNRYFPEPGLAEAMGQVRDDPFPDDMALG